MSNTIFSKYNPRVARAFQAAVADIKSRVVLSRLVAAIERNDIQAALAEINIEPAAYRAFELALVAAYESSAVAVTEATVWRDRDLRKLSLRWNMANPAAEAYIRSVSSDLVTSMVSGQVEAVRASIVNGYSRGQGPRNIALDVVGRVQANGVRQGGVVGLSATQQAARDRVAQRLADGDYRALLNMTTRDKSMDAMLRRGQPLTAAQRERYLRTYTNKSLKTRGDTIARTETARAVETARFDAFNEGLGQTGYPPEAVTKTWLHGGGGMDPRDDHIAMHRVEVQGLNTPFILPDGAVMQHTHDQAGGARHTINCTCTTRTKIDYGWGLV